MPGAAGPQTPRPRGPRGPLDPPQWGAAGRLRAAHGSAARQPATPPFGNPRARRGPLRLWAMRGLAAKASAAAVEVKPAPGTSGKRAPPRAQPAPTASQRRERAQLTREGPKPPENRARKGPDWPLAPRQGAERPRSGSPAPPATERSDPAQHPARRPTADGAAPAQATTTRSRPRRLASYGASSARRRPTGPPRLRPRPPGRGRGAWPRTGPDRRAAGCRRGRAARAAPRRRPR
jgi:hypothetical protein